MIVESYNDDVVLPAELEELWDAITEVCPDCEVRLNTEGACYYVAPSEEYDHYLTPCMASLEDLLEWIVKNFNRFHRNLETYREGGE